MRHIPLEAIEEHIPENWLERAREAMEEVSSQQPDERRNTIDRYSRLWAELKESLAESSYEKCWYCESKQDRYHNAVDHFRPKNQIAECESHPGYWWLAFDWRNYRYSCTYCNSRRSDRDAGTIGGKHDHFPLLDEANRAHTREGDLEAEEPCLLDPTDALDPGLLWFNQDGNAVAKYDEADRSRQHRRAVDSIRLYHLNKGSTVDRRKACFNQIRQLVQDGDRYVELFAEGDPQARYSLKRVIEDLLRILGPSAEFSSASRAYLLGLRNAGREWLDAIFRNY